VLKKLRGEADLVAFVSAGDDLDGPQVPQPQKKLRAKLILDAYGKMGIDAMDLGEKDHVAGVDIAHVRGQNVIDRQGVKLGVFSIDLDTSQDLRGPADALRKDGAKLVVALVHGGLPRVRELLERQPAPIDVAVASHTAFGTQMPERAGETWIVEAAAQSKQLGELDLHILDGKINFQDVGMRGQLESLVWDQEQEIVDLQARADSAQGQVHDFYLKRVQQVRDQMARERQQLGALPSDAAASWIENKQIPLGAEIPNDDEVGALVASYKTEVAKLPPPLPALAAGGGGYAGVDACVSCHAAQVTFWKKTKHARAFESLAKDNHQKDAACTPCHVTAGLMGLPDVQCEACHGPAARHIAQPTAGGIVMRTNTEGQCRACHTKERSTEFEYKTFLSAILGPGHDKKH
jgi:hypothetical protein